MTAAITNDQFNQLNGLILKAHGIIYCLTADEQHHVVSREITSNSLWAVCGFLDEMKTLMAVICDAGTNQPKQAEDQDSHRETALVLKESAAEMQGILNMMNSRLAELNGPDAFREHLNKMHALKAEGAAA